MDNNTLEMPDYPKHYTDIGSLLAILETKALHLGDYENWDDKNDIASIESYAKHNNVSVKVLCLTCEEETVHHWNTFAEGKLGCRIDFNKDEFQKKIEGIQGLVYRKMEYIKRPFELSSYKIDDFPFLKRMPYECEKEFRVFWAGNGIPPTIPIEGLIKRITLSPRVKSYVSDTLKKLLKNNYGIKEVFNSTILSNDEWKNKFS